MGNKNHHHSINLVKNLIYGRWLINKQPLGEVGLCGFLFARFSEKCLSQINEILYLDSGGAPRKICDWVLILKRNVRDRSFLWRGGWWWDFFFLGGGGMWNNGYRGGPSQNIREKRGGHENFFGRTLKWHKVLILNKHSRRDTELLQTFLLTFDGKKYL